jgi:hypothetical protein
MLLGMIGSALGFAWVPLAASRPASPEEATVEPQPVAEANAGLGLLSDDPAGSDDPTGSPDDPRVAEQSYAEQSYAEQSYAEQSYAGQGHAGQPYAEQSYAEQGYDEPAYDGRGQAEPAHGGAGYDPDRPSGDRVTGLLTDTLPEPRNPLREATPPEVAPYPDRDRAGPDPAYPLGQRDGRTGTDRDDDPGPPAAGGELPRRSPRLFAVTILLLSLAAAGVVIVNQGVPAQAAPCKPPARPTPTATTPAPAGPSAVPAVSPTPSPSEKQDEGLLGGIIGGISDGLHDLFGGGDDESAAATPSPSPTGVKPTVAPTEKPGTPGVRPGACTPGKPGAKPSGSPGALPLLGTLTDRPYVNKVPSIMTGTKVTVYKLELAGIAELRTKDGGTIRALDFAMTSAVTENFALKVPGPGKKSQLLKSSALTVDGDVHFYASRFQGKLLGIPVTLTPDLPIPPDGIPLPLPVPVSFTDPQIDLVFVNCNTLKAPNLDHRLV